MWTIETTSGGWQDSNLSNLIKRIGKDCSDNDTFTSIKDAFYQTDDNEFHLKPEDFVSITEEIEAWTGIYNERAIDYAAYCKERRSEGYDHL